MTLLISTSSFPTLGTWIEIFMLHSGGSSPWSFPTLGTWIEIFPCCPHGKEYPSFPTLGTWIEIDSEKKREAFREGRSLHWERGLKSCQIMVILLHPLSSFPTLGTWIEILVC